MSSRARSALGAGGVDTQLAVERVGEPPLESADGFLLGLPLLELAEVVRPPRGVVADLADGDDVQRVVQLTVPTGVETVALLRSRRRLNGCRSVVGGELVTGGEATDGPGATPAAPTNTAMGSWARDGCVTSLTSMSQSGSPQSRRRQTRDVQQCPYPDDQQSRESGQNSSAEERRSDHRAVGWVLALLVLLLLMALPATLAAVAIRPSRATIRAAGMTLMAVVGVVGVLVVIGVLA